MDRCDRFSRYEIGPASRSFLSLMRFNDLPGLEIFIESIIALRGFIGFLVIMLSMYTTVTRRDTGNRRT